MYNKLHQELGEVLDGLMHNGLHLFSFLHTSGTVQRGNMNAKVLFINK